MGKHRRNNEKRGSWSSYKAPGMDGRGRSEGYYYCSVSKTVPRKGNTKPCRSECGSASASCSILVKLLP